MIYEDYIVMASNSQANTTKHREPKSEKIEKEPQNTSSDTSSGTDSDTSSDTGSDTGSDTSSDTDSGTNSTQLQYDPSTHMTVKEKFYKVVQLDADGISRRIIVFREKNESIESLAEVFSETEIAEIELNKVEIIFSKYQLHRDDTIQTLKTKIVLELGKGSFCYNEIYLYSKIKSSLLLDHFYKEITRSDEVPFTKAMLGQLLFNFNIEYNGEPQSTYSYADLVQLLKTSIDIENCDIPIPIGMKFSTFRNLLFSANPFDVLPADEFFVENTSQNILLSFMNNTILNYGVLVDDCFYVCFIEEVLHYAATNSIDVDYMVQLYYPELKEENIHSAEDFKQKREMFISRDRKY